jgi:Tat protein translocase TatB subunit
MFNVGGGELLVILLIALIVLGPDKLPEAARKVGRVTSELRRMSQGFQQEIRQAIDLSDQESSPGDAGPSLPPASDSTPADSTPADRGAVPPVPEVPAPRPGPSTVAGTTEGSEGTGDASAA